MWCHARSSWSASGAARTPASSTAWSRRCTRSAAHSMSRGGSKPCVGLATGSSSRPETAAALHRLRSTLARMRAELEIAQSDREAPPVERLIGDLGEALDLLGEVESAVLAIVHVLVVDDDERLGELTARGLRRLGFDAESAGRLRTLRPREVVVFERGVSGSLTAAELAALKVAQPIVVTGAADPSSRALAEDLGASSYIVKPVELDELAAAIKRRAST